MHNYFENHFFEGSIKILYFVDRLQTLELENTSLREEAIRCRTQSEKLRTEKTEVEEKLSETESVVGCLQDEISSMRDQERRQKDCLLANQQVSCHALV